MMGTMKLQPIAVTEMERLRGSHAWSPTAHVTDRTRNGTSARYTFDDGSILNVYLNGDAAWFHRDPSGDTDGWQRWPNWHHCNRHGR
ncbi:hypothetical protein [Hyphomicrobium sp. DY-1]|uniref:hypothetical protein n=1 Tax=Hyphomicrobium sp. DY-1 TaxID=3075650 RepID=UPI0039C30F74